MHAECSNYANNIQAKASFVVTVIYFDKFYMQNGMPEVLKL